MRRRRKRRTRKTTEESVCGLQKMYCCIVLHIEYHFLLSTTMNPRPPVGITGGATFVAMPSKSRLYVANLTLKRRSLVDTLIQYAKNVCRVPDRLLEPLSKTAPIDWEATDAVEMYRELESSPLVNLKPKPLRRFPRDLPEWVAKNRLTGIWWLITQDMFTSGQMHDVARTLEMVKSARLDEETEGPDPVEMFHDFFSKVLQDNYVRMNPN